MKKALLMGGLLAANVAAGMAQYSSFAYGNEALTLSREESSLGTARYSAMAGAMGAFGGNTSSVKDNPAGLGVYRKWDISLTPNVNIDNDGNADFNINNFGIVFNFGDTKRTNGYVTSSLGITYNRLRNFNRYNYSEGNMSADNLADQDFVNDYSEDDGSGEWDFAYGVNISNKVYFGFGINVVNLDYSMTSIFDSPSDYSYSGSDVTGDGWNLKVGAIIKPVDPLRISLAFQSPTWYDIKRTTYSSYYMDNMGYIPQDEKYELQTPLKFDGGLGFVISDKALIGLNYTFQDFGNMKEKDENGHPYRETNMEIKEDYKAQHTIKVGTEIQMGGGFAFRAGYAFATSPTEDLSAKKISEQASIENPDLNTMIMPKESHTVGLGLGYKGRVFYCDLAYQLRAQKEDYYEWVGTDYDNEPWMPLSQTEKFHNIMATFGVRF